jgi:hypothetical protein
MIEVLRHDTFEFELKPSVRMDEGYLLCEATAAAPGVLQYMQRDGSIRRELVLPETLNNADTLGSLMFKPVTIEHPKVPVNVDNVEEFGIGKVVSVNYDPLGGFAKVGMLIDNPDAIERIDSEQTFRGTSPAYLVQLDETPGVHPEFGRYDAIQVSRLNNHFALTVAPRGGFDRASFRVDSLPSGAAVMLPSHYNLSDQTPDRGDAAPYGVNMPADTTPANVPAPAATAPAVSAPTASIKLDGVDYKMDATIAQAVAKERKDQGDEMAAVKAALAEMTKERDTLKGQLETLQSSKDGGDGDDDADGKGNADSDEARLAWHNERVKLDAMAKQLKLDSYETLGNAALKRGIVEAYRGDSLSNDASDEEVAGAFGMVEHLLAKRGDSIRGVEAKGAKTRKDGETDSRADAVASYTDRLMNAWKPGKAS